MSATAASLAKLLAWRPGGYLRASGVLFSWLAVRTLAQTVLFVLVARTLGADGYGSLIAVMAIATLFAPLAGLGGQALLVRDGARNPENLPTHLGDALRLWAISVVPLSLLAYLACATLLPPTLPAYAVAAIVLADLAGASLLEILARTWQAARQPVGFGTTLATLTLFRLIAFFLLLVLSQPSATSWAVWYSAVTLLYLIFASAVVVRQFGAPKRSAVGLNALAATSFPFAFSSCASRLQAEANKPFLALFTGMANVGSYSAAQRVVDLFLIPIQAMLATATPHLYRTRDLRNATYTIIILPLAISLIGAIAIVTGSNWLPLFLGASYGDAPHIARLLAALPALTLIRAYLSVVLAALNGHRYLYVTSCVGALSGLAGLTILVPLLGSTGAALAAYISEGSVIFLLLLVVFRIYRRSSQKNI